MSNRWIQVLVAISCLLLAACGGGGGGGSAPPPTGSSPPPPPPPPPAPAPTSIGLSSDAGEFIGRGQSYSYSQSDTNVTVTYSGGQFSITLEGNESWLGEFVLPNTYTQLAVGTYENMARFGFEDPAAGGLSWTGEGRGCSASSSRLIIDDVVYDAANLTEIDFQFEQYCDGSTLALRGDIHWNANDATSPPGPVLPPPTSLWEPAAGTVPDTGNFVYLESDPFDNVGDGLTYLYTGATAIITANAADARLSLSITGNETWTGDFQAMNALSFVETGYYPDLQRYPFHNPVIGGLNWSGSGGACNRLSGWFVVDSITYDGNTLTGFELRFEQTCENAAGSLRGAIRWDVNDPTTPPGPVVPPPTGLWEPAAGVTPDTGNYVYLEGGPTDFIVGDFTYLYTQANSEISIRTEEERLILSVAGNKRWRGDFVGMIALTRLEVGYSCKSP